MTSTIRKAVYLSGPMTGIEDYNYPAFHAAAGKLRAQGYAVVNPAESYAGDQSLSFDTYMRHDLTQILEACDTIVVLPGWEDSPGAVLEVAVGVGLGYGILAFQYEGSYASGVSGFFLESVFPVHETNRERLEVLLGLGDWKLEAYNAGFAAGAKAVQDTGGRYVDNEKGEPLLAVPVDLADESDPERYAKAELQGYTPLEAYKRGVAYARANAEKQAGPEPMSTWAEADEGLLKAADHIVNGDRQRTYGHPFDHHSTTAALWQAYLRRANNFEHIDVRPQDVSILMVLDKVSRIGGGDKVDNLLDIAGYAQVHAKVRARQENDA